VGVLGTEGSRHILLMTLRINTHIFW